MSALSIDDYYVYHGSDAWSTDRYEIRNKRGGKIFKSNHAEASSYIAKNLNDLLPARDWGKEAQENFNRIFGNPMDRQISVKTGRLV